MKQILVREDDMETKMCGIVKWFRDDKGFGFIESNGTDYFVHFKGILGDGFKSLPRGASVRFKALKGEKGPLAEEVELIKL